MNLKEALKLRRFEIMKRRGLPPPKPSVDYERLNYYAFERHITRVEKQNERMIEAVEKIANKQADPVAENGYSEGKTAGFDLTLAPKITVIHAKGCWSRGPQHYECACAEIAKLKGWSNGR
jgi:hypothetical protein